MNSLTPTENPEQGTTMEHILQEIAAVGRWLEEIDSTIPTLAAETKSMRLDIAGFQSRVSHLEQHVIAVEANLNTISEWDQELLFLCSKLIDLEDRNSDGYEIRIAADFSKETNECHKTFLSLRPRIRQLEMKYRLFEPTHMWVTKNRQSKDLYDPEDLQLYLNDLSTKFMDLTPPSLPDDATMDSSDASLGRSLSDRETHQRGRDPARHSRPHDDRGKALLAVAHYTQQMDRDKSHSTVKSIPTPT
ncbi:hypothetical protein NDU88_002528 [Pleurodeles waltl]|uniref:Uncharacterized protein n=1 Tax=Pleurodeles waltl TaxID=8319 RepID=A0AAV7VDJ7_PLEWA|nr:hypothetical protein NDU88_002528 [Pleurodeles waltl]